MLVPQNDCGFKQEGHCVKVKGPEAGDRVPVTGPCSVTSDWCDLRSCALIGPTPVT